MNSAVTTQNVITGTAVTPEEIWAYVDRQLTVSSGLDAAQSLMLNELWAIQGLDVNNPMTVTRNDRTSGSLNLSITGDGTTTSTVTRQ